MIVKKKHVNIRKEPNTRSSIVGKTNYGIVFATPNSKKAGPRSCMKAAWSAGSNRPCSGAGDEAAQ
jgi:hypothetical protein